MADSRRKRWRVVLWSLLALLVVVYLVARIAAPRALAPARVLDPVAAKAAGDALVASRDATTLVVVAHPDDVEWWAGGTAAMLAEHNKVVLVVGTSGERGDAGLVANLGAMRERLQREGGAILGYSDIVFLRNPDGGLASATVFPRQVADAFATYRPANVITFDAAREAAGRTAAAVAEQLGGVTLYLMHTSAPDVLVDYAPVKDKKARAFAILTSYHDAVPVVGWLGGLVGRLLGPSAPTYGSRAAYPQVGVDFGEVFRRVVIPEK
jgi:hypothetical protein